MAQTYDVTASHTPFVALENPQVLTDEPWDILEFQLPLGFEFEFFDITTEDLFCIANSFGGDFELNEDIDHLYQVLPFFAGLIDRGYQQDSALSPIHYKTEGMAGERVFTLEFIEAGLFNGLETEEGIFLDYISFQLRLFEASGDIEFHIGPHSILEDPVIVFDNNPGPGPVIGLLADAESMPGGQIGELILLTGDPLNPTVTDDIVSLNWPIPEHTLYRFSRMGTSVDDHLSDAKQPFFFPNPTSGIIHLNEMYANDILYPIIVLDVLGKPVCQWNAEAALSAVHLPAGSYFAIVRTQRKVVAEKILVLPE
jgi:hypothetical protein